MVAATKPRWLVGAWAHPALIQLQPVRGQTVSRRFFVSYSRSDRQLVVPIADELSRRGHDAFLDERSIEPGADFFDTIVERLRASDVLLVMMTPAGEQSSWVKKEIQLALRERKAIIPVLLSGRHYDILIDLQGVAGDGSAAETVDRILGESGGSADVASFESRGEPSGRPTGRAEPAPPDPEMDKSTPARSSVTVSRRSLIAAGVATAVVGGGAVALASRRSSGGNRPEDGQGNNPADPSTATSARTTGASPESAGSGVTPAAPSPGQATLGPGTTSGTAGAPVLGLWLDGSTFAATTESRLLLLDADTAEELAAFDLDRPTPPRSTGGFLAIAAKDKFVRGYRDGAVTAKAETETWVKHPAVVVDDVVYAVDESVAYALRDGTQTWLWRVPLPALRIAGPPMVSGGRLCLIGSDANTAERRVYTFDLATGEMNRSRPFDGAADRLVAVYGDSLAYATYSDLVVVPANDLDTPSRSIAHEQRLGWFAGTAEELIRVDVAARDGGDIIYRHGPAGEINDSIGGTVLGEPALNDNGEMLVVSDGAHAGVNLARPRSRGYAPLMPPPASAITALAIDSSRLAIGLSSGEILVRAIPT